MRRPDEYFEGSEYIMGDTAYILTERLIIPYKGAVISQENQDFNREFSRVRVVIEHVMGLLKARWSSLRGMRIQVRSKNDLFRMTRWITSCFILHNIMVDSNDEWQDELDIIEHVDIQGHNVYEQGWEKRERLKAEVREFHS